MAVKVREVNIERGLPTVDTALKNLVNGLATAKMQGAKAAVVIHGYGSSGTGGKIRPAARAKLKSPELRGIVRDSVPGEKWYERKNEFLDICPALKEFARDIDGNMGITVVLLK
ncbi:MAG: Smr/MutS family protein [Anaerovoracaceae bacterium]|nr:Smr/MutS family protein [Anaerovoracaceae bacterium]